MINKCTIIIYNIKGNNQGREKAIFQQSMRTSKDDNCSNSEHPTLSLKSNIYSTCCYLLPSLPLHCLILKGQKNSSKENIHWKIFHYMY